MSRMIKFLLRIFQRKSRVPKDLEGAFYGPWPTLDDLIKDVSVTIERKEGG